MRPWAFPFILGAVVGGFAGLIIGEGEPEASSPPPSPAAPAPAPPPPSPEPSPLAADVDDATLAQALDLARFDGNWKQVTAVARVLRERIPATAAGARPAGEGQLGGLLALDGQGSLLALDQEYRHLLAWLEVRERDNRATRLLQRETDPAELARRLTELFLLPPATPEDEVVLGDAARLLAWTHREEARRALLTALQDPLPLRAEQAAQALAASRDPEAEAALVAALREEREPELRARLARALGQGDLRPGGPAVDALATAALSDRDPTVRAEALAGLVRADLARSTQARAALIEVTEREAEPEELRLGAVRAILGHYRLARSLPPEVIVSLEGLLERTIPPVRLAVIQALGEAGRAESLALVDNARLKAQTAEERAALEEAVLALRRRTIPE